MACVQKEEFFAVAFLKKVFPSRLLCFEPIFLLLTSCVKWSFQSLLFHLPLSTHFWVNHLFWLVCRVNHTHTRARIRLGASLVDFEKWRGKKTTNFLFMDGFVPIIASSPTISPSFKFTWQCNELATFGNWLANVETCVSSPWLSTLTSSTSTTCSRLWIGCREKDVKKERRQGSREAGRQGVSEWVGGWVNFFYWQSHCLPYSRQFSNFHHVLSFPDAFL